MALLEVEGLVKKFGDYTALDNVSFSIGERTGVVGLIGPNGAGKTTLISSIMGLIKIDSGRISYNNNRLNYCPDMPAFEEYLRAWEVLSQVTALNGVKSKFTYDQLLLKVGLLEHKDRLVGGFSRGMKQRLAIAQCLSTDPDILFLDEPTSALDALGRKKVLDIIEELSKERLVVVSSHALYDIYEVCDSLLVINKGKLLYEGSVNDFVSRVEGELCVITCSDGAAASFLEEVFVKLEGARINIEEDILEVEGLELGVVLEILRSYPDLVLKIEKGQKDIYTAFYESLQE